MAEKDFGKKRKPFTSNSLIAARITLALMLIFLILTLAGSTAQAHGSGAYLIRGTVIAPYSVHVWAAPGVMRTGNVHVDVATINSAGEPDLGTFVLVSFIPLDSEALPLESPVGAPSMDYPYPREATFQIEREGDYRLEVFISDSNGASGSVSADVLVRAISWQVKAAIAALFLASAASGLWLLYQTRIFWLTNSVENRLKVHRLQKYAVETNLVIQGDVLPMENLSMSTYQQVKPAWLQRLNGPLHAPAVWTFMLIIVAHWLEHVMQIYQIYAMGWAPSSAGGILGVFFPQLIESEMLHFVYDFIQWAGIVLLRPGFHGRARTYWNIALVVQSWHFIEHVLLMGQYLTGYYFFGAAQQTSILQYWFPRAELHFVYNLLVFVPMVLAIHEYVKPKIQMLTTLESIANQEQNRATEQR